MGLGPLLKKWGGSALFCLVGTVPAAVIFFDRCFDPISNH